MLFDGTKYFKLDYTHEEIVALLEKLKTNHILTLDEYKKLHSIFQDLERFNYDYNNLINTPYIPSISENEIEEYNKSLKKIRKKTLLFSQFGV